MNATEKYRFELPDYIAGKASAAIAQEIERLIATNADFRAEYESMKNVARRVEAFSETATAEMEKSVPPFYFANFADRLEARLADARQTPLQRLRDAIRRLFERQKRMQLAGVFTLALAALTLFNAAQRLDFHLTSGDVASLRRAQSETQDEKNVAATARVAAIQFAAGFIPEVSISSLSDEEEIAVLNKLKEELPSLDDGDFKVLSDEDVESLLPTL